MRISFSIQLFTGTAIIAALSSKVTAQGPPPIAPEIFYLLTTIPTLVPTIKKYETPMAARFASYYDATWWNCVAALSTNYKDSITKDRPIVSSPNDTDTHTTSARATCVTQATASLNDLFFDGIDEYLEAMEENFPALSIEDQVPSDVRACLVSSRIPVETNSEATAEGRKRLRSKSDKGGGEDEEESTTIVYEADPVCMNNVALQSNYDPTTMGHIIALQTYAYSMMDGYNQMGTDGGCTVNCRPYTDTTGYAPVDRVGRWKPLMEENNKGFFYKQEFVAPHVGQKAKYRYLPESDRIDRVVRKPNYTLNRKLEMEEVINQMALLDDYKKVEIEAFDDKLYTTTQIIGAFVNKVLMDGYVDTELGQDGLILSFERLLHFNAGITGAELDSIIIAWKEKVRYDLVRPTTVIKERGNEQITTWAKNEGISTFSASSFEAYIRVMPHAEYTSGSSCLFEAVKDYVESYLVSIGLNPSNFPITFPTINVGESKVEPGVTPEAPITLTYGNIAEMASAGSMSRFNGGMHFRDSVPAGQELCAGIGTIAASAVDGLIKV